MIGNKHDSLVPEGFKLNCRCSRRKSNYKCFACPVESQANQTESVYFTLGDVDGRVTRENKVFTRFSLHYETPLRLPIARFGSNITNRRRLKPSVHDHPPATWRVVCEDMRPGMGIPHPPDSKRYKFLMIKD
jgi:hypothetical protein